MDEIKQSPALDEGSRPEDESTQPAVGLVEDDGAPEVSERPPSDATSVSGREEEPSIASPPQTSAPPPAEMDLRDVSFTSAVLGPLLQEATRALDPPPHDEPSSVHEQQPSLQDAFSQQEGASWWGGGQQEGQFFDLLAGEAAPGNHSASDYAPSSATQFYRDPSYPDYYWDGYQWVYSPQPQQWAPQSASHQDYSGATYPTEASQSYAHETYLPFSNWTEVPSSQDLPGQTTATSAYPWTTWVHTSAPLALSPVPVSSDYTLHNPLPTNASWTAPSSSTAPRSTGEASTSNAGRPPCPLFAFGFGGRIARLGAGGTNVIVKGLRDFLCDKLSTSSASPLPTIPWLGPSELDPARDRGIEKQKKGPDLELLERTAGPIRDLLLGLEKFPGPLASPVAPARLKQLELHLQERASSVLDPDLRALYLLLSAAVTHRGILRATVGQSGSSETTDSVESSIARALSSVPSTSQAPALHRELSVPAENPEAVARRVQQLLMEGRKTEAAYAAVSGGLFALAALLASECAPEVRQEVTTHIVQHTLQPGSSLHDYLLIAAGRPLASLRDPVSLGPLQGQGTEKSTDTQSKFGLSGFLSFGKKSAPVQQETEPPEGGLPLNPFATPGPAAQPTGAPFSPVCDPEEQWASLLSMLACTRPQGDLEAIRQLGLRLLQKGKVAAAHCCLLLAPPCLPGPLRAEEPLCLLGADHRLSPRTFACVDAVQRTEVLEWVLQLHWSPASAMAGPVQAAILALQPYRLLTALRLAEVGHVQQAIKYCEAILATLRLSPRLPPSLMICRDLVTDLDQRLRVQSGAAPASASGPAGSSSLVGSLGRLLDKGISRLVGIEGGEVPLDGLITPSASVANFSAPFGGGFMTPSPSRAPLSPEPFRNEVDGAQLSGLSSSPLPPSGSVTNGSQTPDLQPKDSKKHRDRRQGSIGSLLLTGIGTGITGLLGPLTKGVKGDKEMKLGESNRFYFDEKLGCWREEGVDAAPVTTPPPPPPSAGLGWLPSATAPPTAGATAAGHGGALTGDPLQPASFQPPPVPAAPAPPRVGVRSRYVDAGFGGSASGTSSSAGASLLKPPLAPSLAPSAAPMKFFMPVSAPVAEASGDGVNMNGLGS